MHSAGIDGSISFQHVNFRYAQRDDVEVLKDVSFEIKEISCLEVMDFVRYLNGSPTPSFFPGLRLGGLGGRRLPWAASGL